MTREKDTLVTIGACLVILMVIAVCTATIMMARRDIAKSKQPVVYQVDTTKARILFEDTWGKIILIKEEDL